MSKIVFLTGGTGSFGTGFISHLLDDPEIGMIRVFSRNEHRQRELAETFNNDRVSFFIGDVRDYDRVLDAMEGCHWVVHAAALKQAPLGERQAQEFVKTNVMGSMNVVNAALSLGIEKAVLISTDKAVEPVNLYGATKMCAERVFIQADACRGTRKTRFACTRYGNVAGTSGSIIPILLSRKSILGPVIVHDPEATRFWITLKEANEFVLDSIKRMRGGEVFIPKLRSVRVMDIIQALRPNEPITIAGPRPGDKRHEVLDVNGRRYTSDDNEFITPEEIRSHVFSEPLYGPPMMEAD